MNGKKVRFFICTIFLFLITGLSTVSASTSNGTIDSTYKYALVCHEVTCSTIDPGVINFKPTGSTPVTIEDNAGIDGVAWGNELGWINFDPTGEEEVVVDASTGIVSGKAWSQVSGWINFSVTGQSVQINSNGEFEGWAWTGGVNGGWIKFNCSNDSSCVKTDWRSLQYREASSEQDDEDTSVSRQSYSRSGLDVCPNLGGLQTILPLGYSQDQGGFCVLGVDYCPNIFGKQVTVPVNHVVDNEGKCIEVSDKNEEELFDMTNTISSEGDMCINLYGIQTQLPDGFIFDKNNFCIPENTDYCPNIDDKQLSVPEDMFVRDDGDCYEIKDINDPSVMQTIKDNVRKKTILSYSFIPEKIKIPLDIIFLNNFTKYAKIDLISILITFVGMLLPIQIYLKFKV